MMIHKSILLFAGFALGASACSSSAEKSAAPPARTSYNMVSVEGFVVKPSVLTANVTASGTLLPLEETELHPEASGRVVSLHLPEGKAVRKGDLLLKVFDQDLQTQVSKLGVQLKQAEITEQRLAELLKVKGVSQQEYDLAALEVQTIKSEIELLRINITKTELRAPYDGVIGLRKISPGAYVTPASAIATIRSSGALKLDFAIPEKYSGRIHPGQAFSFTVEGSPTRYTAVVQATEQRITADTRNLQVRGLVRGNASGLLPGGFAEVEISLGNNSQALLIPSQAIVPQARDKKVFVSRGGKVASVAVKTGVRQSGMVEITDGLAAGDTIAITGVLFLRPDSPVKFSKIQ